MNRTTQRPETLTIFQKITGRDQTGVSDYVDAYGNFIWALAKNFTASTEEAEAATLEIFLDIQRYAENGKKQSVEECLTALLARRRLIKQLL